jgi:uncharacterized tellurite resistance protein B-like protein
MGSSDLLRHLFKNLNLDKYLSRRGADEPVELTAHLSLVTGVIYMMIADGEVSEQESSHLQSIIGGNEEVLHRALSYVEANSIDEYLETLPKILSNAQKVCILMNICDSIMADGELADDEKELFSRFLAAVGLTEESFKPYLRAISVKNERDILGSFNQDFTPEELNPPLILAICLIYMMSSDGQMAKEEIGQLHMVIGKCPSLLQSALKYVGKNKAPKFLKAAAELLDPMQRLCVLTNVWDIVLTDGSIEKAEIELFKKMLLAFGYTQASFNPYFNILQIKNNKPEEDRYSNRNSNYAVQGGSRNSSNNNHKAFVPASAPRPGISTRSEFVNAIAPKRDNTRQNALDSIIGSQMQSNIDSLANVIQEQEDLDDITDNATYTDNELNAQLQQQANDDEDVISSLGNNDGLSSIKNSEIDAFSSFQIDPSNPNARSNLAKGLGAERGKNFNDFSISASDRSAQGLSGTTIAQTLGNAYGTTIDTNQVLVQNRPSLLSPLIDASLKFDFSAITPRMQTVQDRTAVIHTSLEKVNSHAFHLKDIGRKDMTSQSLATQDGMRRPRQRPVAVTGEGHTNHTGLTLAASNDHLHSQQVSESNTQNESNTGVRLIASICFTILCVAHGFTSYGESLLEKQILVHEHQAVVAHNAFQSVAAQQVNYQLSANDLALTLQNKDALTDEQVDVAQTRLVLYQSTIQSKESSPDSKDGKKELQETAKHEENLVAEINKQLNWLIIAKSIFLLGLGLSVMGFFSKSRWLAIGSTTTFLAGVGIGLTGFFGLI